MGVLKLVLATGFIFLSVACSESDKVNTEVVNSEARIQQRLDQLESQVNEANEVAEEEPIGAKIRNRSRVSPFPDEKDSFYELTRLIIKNYTVKDAWIEIPNEGIFKVNIGVDVVYRDGFSAENLVHEEGGASFAPPEEIWVFADSLEEAEVLKNMVLESDRVMECKKLHIVSNYSYIPVDSNSKILQCQGFISSFKPKKAELEPWEIEFLKLL